MEKCYLIQWPESQMCIGCEHGTFVMGGEDDAKIGDSAYLCFYNNYDTPTICHKKRDEIKVEVLGGVAYCNDSRVKIIDHDNKDSDIQSNGNAQAEYDALHLNT